MIYEIINPSDPYTIEAEDLECAAVAVAVLGVGKYGLRSIDGKERSPVLLGWDKWLAERGIDLDKYISKHLIKIAEILETILIGNVEERKQFLESVKGMSVPARKMVMAERHYRLRSSMNDIGTAAMSIAQGFRYLQEIASQDDPEQDKEDLSGLDRPDLNCPKL